MKTNAPPGRKPMPPLSIAVDCGALSAQDERNYGGIYTVTVNLLTQLGRIDKRHTYLLYSFEPIDPLLLTQFGKRMRNIVVRPKYGYKTFGLPLRFSIDHPDVFLALSQAVPWNVPKAVGFVYDLAFIKYPRAYRNPARLWRQTDEVVARSAHIMTISEATKDDLMKHYGLRRQQISVNYPGAQAIFHKDGPKFYDSHPYFLYVGALKKTKNIPKLLEGFFKFLRVTKKDFRLVLVGSDTELDPEIGRTIDRYHLQRHIFVKGYVAQDDLPKYYRGAYAFVSPALYEGFGLPALEAMACGCPVIIGDTSAMPEVVGDAGIKVRVEDGLAIFAALRQLVENKQLRSQLVRRGLAQAKKFSSRQFARGVLKIIYQVQKNTT